MNTRSYALVFVTVAIVSTAVALVARTFYDVRLCPTSGYTSDMYLAYCGTSSFGDYEHGAFYFGTEPSAIAAAQNADVIFLGNSRVQFALSNPGVVEFFRSRGLRFYNLSFGYISGSENAAGILRRWELRPRVVVINADPFFYKRAEAPLVDIRQHPLSTFALTVRKALAQRAHAMARRLFPGPARGAIFRSRRNGGWDFSLIIPDTTRPIDPLPSPAGDLTDMIRRAEAFSPLLPKRKECTVLTFIPESHYSWDGTKILAASMGASYVTPSVEGLVTIDGNHLNPSSAAKWSLAFLRELEPFLDRCLKDSSTTEPLSMRVRREAYGDQPQR